ncbi:hypothetical protein B566_EDAN001262 [Ephemera danica]|nr:hypothetical protein B566_EDAN001262 [Ephemera danica]
MHFLIILFLCSKITTADMSESLLQKNGGPVHLVLPTVPPVQGSLLMLSKPLSRRGLVRQVRAASAADLASLGVGLVLGYSAVALPQLQKHDSWILLTEDQASWFVLMERWGRRTTLQLQCIPSALGWALIASARGVPQLYAGRLLTGLGGGMVDATCQVYIGEVSTPGVRGAIGASSSLCFSLGVLLVYVLGWARLPWTLLAGLCGAVPVLGLLALCFVPESPVWLAARGRVGDARRAALWLHGLSEQEDIPLGEIPRGNRTGPADLLRSLFSQQTARPFCILLAFFFFQQFCGMNAVVFYAVNIFQGDVGSNVTAMSDEVQTGWLDAHQSAVLIGLTRFVMTAATCVLLAHVGRRPLSLISGLGMSAAMFALGTALYVQREQTGSDPAVVLPCLILFIAANTVGFFAVPWVMLGELLPEKCRGVASGLVSAIVYSFVFVVVKTYPLLLDAMGQAGAFWVYGAIALIGSLFVLALLPETKGKTLNEIERSFNKKSNPSNDINNKSNNL